MPTFNKPSFILCVALGLAQLSASATESGTSAGSHSLYVYGTIDALLAGSYDGELEVGDLAKKGSIGLGTFNRLNGELVMLDGQTFHVKADGSVSVARPREKTPLAYVMPFVPSETFAIDAGSATAMPEIERQLDQRLANKNLFYAVKVSGQFASLTTRAIAPQTRPYRPLAEVAKEQVVFTRQNIAGSLVGIRSPAFSKGISVPGWHWHFIADDRTFGGHVLNGSLTKGVLRIATAREFNVVLPDTEDFGRADQSKDRAAELHQVESDRPTTK